MSPFSVFRMLPHPPPVQVAQEDLDKWLQSTKTWASMADAYMSIGMPLLATDAFEEAMQHIREVDSQKDELQSAIAAGLEEEAVQGERDDLEMRLEFNKTPRGRHQFNDERVLMAQAEAQARWAVMTDVHPRQAAMRTVHRVLELKPNHRRALELQKVLNNTNNMKLSPFWKKLQQPLRDDQHNEMLRKRVMKAMHSAVKTIGIVNAMKRGAV